MNFRQVRAGQGKAIRGKEIKDNARQGKTILGRAIPGNGRQVKARKFQTKIPG